MGTVSSANHASIHVSSSHYWRSNDRASRHPGYPARGCVSPSSSEAKDAIVLATDHLKPRGDEQCSDVPRLMIWQHCSRAWQRKIVDLEQRAKMEGGKVAQCDCDRG